MQKLDDNTINILKNIATAYRSFPQQILQGSPAAYREGPVMKVAQTTTTVAVGGSGQANLCSFANGAVSAATTNNVKVFSIATSSIASGTTVVVAYIDGVWLIVFQAC